MPRIVPTFHRTDRMAPDHREALIAEILAVDKQVFTDAPPAAVVDAYRGKNVDGCWVMVLRHNGRLVGYNAVRQWFDEAGGRPFAIWRTRAAVLKAYRRASITGLFASAMYLKFRLRHPLTPLYTFNTLIHPSSFRLFATHVAEMYPFPETAQSPREREVYERALALFGLDRVDGAAPFVVHDPTVVETSPQEVARWAASEAPCTQFFLKHNPEYGRGRAIATLIPLTVSVVWGFTKRLLARKVRRALRRRQRHPLESNPVTGNGAAR